MRSILVPLWVVWLATMPQTAGASQEPSPVILRGPRVMVEARATQNGLQERYLALENGNWVEVARAASGLSIGPVLVSAVPGVLTTNGFVLSLSVSNKTLIEQLAAGPRRIIRKVRLCDEASWLQVTTRMEVSSETTLHEFSDHFMFLSKPDWSFSPSVGGFNPDAQYKAPLILVQTGRAAFGIVPDLTPLDRDILKRCNHALVLDLPAGPQLGVGFIPARLTSQSVYSPDTNRTWTAETPVENGYYLFVSASAVPGQAYREAVRAHWKWFGQPAQAMAANQQVGTDPRYRKLALWGDWRKKVWDVESVKDWVSAPLPDGAMGGGVRTRRWGPGPSVYLSSWFNTLRTSYGMALYARRNNDEKLLNLARQTVELALKAPGTAGAFKCIAVPGKQGEPTLWAAGDGRGGSTKDGFLGYDMCWTGYWLLRWRASDLPGSEGVLPRCRALARFMIARQMEDGMLPTRFDEDGSVQEELSRAVKAETGPVALFLLELYAQDPNPKYLEAARRGLGFLEEQVIPKRQWYDYETFWSCSPRKAHLDPRTQQWPANDLALSQTVEALLLAARLTGRSAYLASGEALLDYLLLYQQCWTNPALENLSCDTMLLGGFTTQNSDAEWSDARQSQCGNILLDYYRATGNAEYLERGVAALRAQFPISPSENWAHTGYGGKAGVSSFHWGTGSGMAGIEIEEDYLRDAIVDVRAGLGVGVNGLNLSQCNVRQGQIEFRLSSPFSWEHKPVVVFRHAEPSREYRLVVNGKDAGTWTGSELGKGIQLPPLQAR